MKKPTIIVNAFLSTEFFSLHFLNGKKMKQKKPPRLKNEVLSCPTISTRTKADKTSFRATRGHAYTHGESSA